MSCLPAVLENNVWSNSPVLHQDRDQTTLHLRLLTEHWLDRNLQQSKGTHVDIRTLRRGSPLGNTKYIDRLHLAKKLHYLKFSELDAPLSVSDDREKLLLFLWLIVQAAEICSDSCHSLK